MKSISKSKPFLICCLDSNITNLLDKWGAGAVYAWYEYLKGSTLFVDLCHTKKTTIVPNILQSIVDVCFCLCLFCVLVFILFFHCFTCQKSGRTLDISHSINQDAIQ